MLGKLNFLLVGVHLLRLEVPLAVASLPLPHLQLLRLVVEVIFKVAHPGLPEGEVASDLPLAVSLQSGVPLLRSLRHLGAYILVLDLPHAYLRNGALREGHLLFRFLIASGPDADSLGHEVGKRVVVALVDGGLLEGGVLVLGLLPEGLDLLLPVPVAERPRLVAALMARQQADSVHPRVFIEEFGEAALLEVETIGIGVGVVVRVGRGGRGGVVGEGVGGLLAVVLELGSVLVAVLVAIVADQGVLLVEVIGRIFAHPVGLVRESPDPAPPRPISLPPQELHDVRLCHPDNKINIQIPFPLPQTKVDEKGDQNSL